MTRKQQRAERLMPGGIPKWVRIYDNGGESYDRYTCLFTGHYKGRYRGKVEYRAMSEYPFHPQGFGQWGEGSSAMDAHTGWPPAIGRKCHLGTRIPFDALPEDCKRLVVQDYKDLWNINA